MPVPSRRSSSAQSGGAEHVIVVAVSFSTQRKAEMSSFEPRRMPAWLAPVCEERSVSHSASRVRLARPARHVRGIAVAHRALQHGLCEPVDLEVDDPGDVGAGDDALALGDPLRDADRPHVVRAEKHREHDAHRGDDERGEERPAEVVDGEHAVGHVRLGGELKDERVRDQHEQEAEDERERQPQRGEHRRDDRVQRRDDRRDDERAPEALDVDAREDPRGHHQARRPSRTTTTSSGNSLHARTLGLPGMDWPYVGSGSLVVMVSSLRG